MDPKARKHVWNAVSLVRDQGTAVLLTSHLMEEVEALCSRLGIMVKGRFKSLGSPQQLKSKLGRGYSIVARLSVEPQLSTSKTKTKRSRCQDQSMELKAVKAEKHRWGSVLRKFHCFLTANFQNCILKESHTGYVRYMLEARNTPWSEIFTAMEQAKTLFRLESYTVGQVDLENVFLHCIQTKD